MNFSISVVSHGSGSLMRPLLDDLRSKMPADSEVIITINKPEDESYLDGCAGLPLRVLRNARPMGFGANHNQAFAVAQGDIFAVVNPDVRLPVAPFAALASALQDPAVGACAPKVLAPHGGIEDSFRRFPTFARLARRVVLGQRVPDYSLEARDGAFPVDWTAGMFVAFRRQAFLEVQGFDTRYFMYMEDADICRRIWRNGQRVLLVPSVHVVHDAQRASRRDWRHRGWHTRSALRFLLNI